MGAHLIQPASAGRIASALLNNSGPIGREAMRAPLLSAAHRFIAARCNLVIWQELKNRATTKYDIHMGKTSLNQGRHILAGTGRNRCAANIRAIAIRQYCLGGLLNNADGAPVGAYLRRRLSRLIRRNSIPCRAHIAPFRTTHHRAGIG